MRLIYALVSYLTIFGISLVRAADVLDLDNFDPYSFDHVTQAHANYNEETFVPKAGGDVHAVTDADVTLWSDDQPNSVLKKATVYTQSNLPQLVKLEVTDDGRNVYKHFFRLGNEYKPFNKGYFDHMVTKLDKAEYPTDFQFTLNLQNNQNARHLFSKEHTVEDGVNVAVYQPVAGKAQLTKVVDGNEVVTSVGKDESVKKVKVSLKHDERVLAVVEYATDGNTVASFFKKENGAWKQVTQQEFDKVTPTLRSVDVYGKLTLDVSEPQEDQYHVEKDFEGPMTKVTYNPNAGYDLVKVVKGTQELWSSVQDRATTVQVVNVRDQLKLVKVTVKTPDNNVTDYNLGFEDDAVKLLSDEEYSKQLTDLENNAGVAKRAEVPDETAAGPEKPVSTDLELLAPNDLFLTKTARHRGVHFKEFVPKTNVHVSKLTVSGKSVWERPDSDTVKSARLYYKLSQPAVFEVYVKGDNGDVLRQRKAEENGKWHVMFPHDFYTFLKEAVSPPKFDASVVLNLEEPEGEHVSVDESVVFNVPTRTVQAKTGYFFKVVKFGDQVLFTVDGEHNAGVTLDKAVVHLEKNQVAPLPKLVALGGYKNDEYVEFHFVFDGDKWTQVFDHKFYSELSVLRFPGKYKNLGQKGEGEKFLGGPEEATEEGEEVAGPSSHLRLYPLDTKNVNQDHFQVYHGSEGQLYFTSYTPKNGAFFGQIKGPEGFEFKSVPGKLGVYLKFLYAYGELVGAQLNTVSTPQHSNPLEYYFTHKDGVWKSSLSQAELNRHLMEKVAYSEEDMKDLEKLRKTEEHFEKTMEKVREDQQKELERERKKKEKEEAVKPREFLSKKTKLYNEMLDFDNLLAPPETEEVPETKEEFEARMQAYASGEKFPVGSNMVYYEMSKPHDNTVVHSKDYVSMGLKALDATPFSGKHFHAVSLNGKRLWVASGGKKCTNLQMLYDDEQLVAVVLRVTVTKHNKRKTGEEFDHLFLTDGELKTVTNEDFVRLANARFQKAALVEMSKGHFS